jgi:hypothetical protein
LRQIAAPEPYKTGQTRQLKRGAEPTQTGKPMSLNVTAPAIQNHTAPAWPTSSDFAGPEPTRNVSQRKSELPVKQGENRLWSCAAGTPKSTKHAADTANQWRCNAQERQEAYEALRRDYEELRRQYDELSRDYRHALNRLWDGDRRQ